MTPEAMLNTAKYRFKRGWSGVIFTSKQSEQYYLAVTDSKNAAERAAVARKLAHSDKKWTLEEFIKERDIAWWNDFQLGADCPPPSYDRLFRLLFEAIAREQEQPEGEEQLSFAEIADALTPDPAERAIIRVLSDSAFRNNVEAIGLNIYQLTLRETK